MARTLTFKDCNISFLKIENEAPVEIKNTDNNVIDNIRLSPNGDNLDKNLIIVDGNFGSSDIEIKSSCTFQSNPTFICGSPVKIYTSLNDTIVLLGNFSLSSGVTILAPTKILSGTNIQLENLDLVINYEQENKNGLNLSGNFSKCRTFIESSSNINLDCVMGETIVQKDVTNVALNLSPWSTINDLKAKSKVLVSGDEASVNKVIANTSEGVNNVEKLYNTFIMDALSGSGQIKFNLSATGKYKISFFVVDDVTDIPIGTPAIIEIQ